MTQPHPHVSVPFQERAAKIRKDKRQLDALVTRMEASGVHLSVMQPNFEAEVKHILDLQVHS